MGTVTKDDTIKMVLHKNIFVPSQENGKCRINILTRDERDKL